MITVRTLVCHRDVTNATVCLKSLMKLSQEKLVLVLHDDGTLTEQDCETLQLALPGSHVLARKIADEQMQQILRKHPVCSDLRNWYPLSLKLLDVALLAEEDIAYCDTDVFFLRPFTGLFQFNGSNASSIFMSDPNQAYSARPWHLAPLGPLELPASVNTGIIFFRKQAYDLDFIEWLWKHPMLQRIFRHIACWAEQTCWAALGRRTGCVLWSPAQFEVVSDTWSPGPETIAGHFVTSYRARLHDFSGRQPPMDCTAHVETVASKECGILRLASHQFHRKSKRISERTFSKR